MGKPTAKIKDHELFHLVLRLISSCSNVVAQELDGAEHSVSELSPVDGVKLSRTAVELRKLGFLARLLEQTTLEQDQRAIRGGRSQNIRTSPQKRLSITRDEEHVIACKSDGDALV